MNSDKITVTSNASGVGSGKTKNMLGKLSAIVYTKPSSGGFADGVVITVKSVRSGLTMWSKTLSTNASETVYPRVALQDYQGAAITYDGTRPIYDQFPVINDEIEISVASAGDTLSGTFEVLLA